MVTHHILAFIALSHSVALPTRLHHLQVNVLPLIDVALCSESYRVTAAFVFNWSAVAWPVSGKQSF